MVTLSDTHNHSFGQNYGVLIEGLPLPLLSRDVFVVDEAAWHDMLLRVDQVYAPMIAAFDRALAELPRTDPARRRIRLSREFLTFVSEEMAALSDKWDARARELDLD